ncbi:MAG: helix-turn-helix transcriptional regulator [Candidatus Dormibacteria bacterium]
MSRKGDNAHAVGEDRNLRELITAGFAAMAAHDWATARDSLASAAEIDPTPSPEVLEGLAASLYLLGYVIEARRPMERAFTGFREAGELRRAIQAAAFLVGSLDSIGEYAAAQGWEGRGKRLLEEVGACAEEGYLALARVGCNVADPSQLEASAELALNVARQFSDRMLETRALGDKGLALVSQGRVEEGLALLDEAVVTVVAGEVTNPGFIGKIMCAMLSACERAGDLARAELWSSEIDEYSQRIGRPPFLYAHCHTVYGAVLALSGRWEDAERELQRAISIAAPQLHSHNDARAQLANMRIRQGRLDDAEKVLAGLDHDLEAAPAVAHLQFSRHGFGAAATTIERALRALRNDRMRAAPLLALLVQVHLGGDDGDAARRAAERLTKLSGECSSNEIRAMARLAAGRIAIYQGDHPTALDELETALTLLIHRDRPLLMAQVRLELARALAKAGENASALVEAEAALATFHRLGVVPGIHAGDALIQELAARDPAAVPPGELAVQPPLPGAGVESLTQREAEVARLVAAGQTNREVAERLFLSVRTVECHLDRVLGKLDFHTRTQLASWVSQGQPPHN